MRIMLILIFIASINAMTVEEAAKTLVDATSLQGMYIGDSIEISPNFAALKIISSSSIDLQKLYEVAGIPGKLHILCIFYNSDKEKYNILSTALIKDNPNIEMPYKMGCCPGKMIITKLIDQYISNGELPKLLIDK